MILLSIALLLLVLAPFGAALPAPVNGREQYQHYRVRRQATATSTTLRHKGDNEGTALELYTWGDAEVYWGIPYAKAPVGNLTFAPPVDFDAGEEPKKVAGCVHRGIINWLLVFQQMNDFPRPACPQIETGHGLQHKRGTYFGSPNCLTLDIYMPYREELNKGVLPRAIESEKLDNYR